MGGKTWFGCVPPPFLTVLSPQTSCPAGMQAEQGSDSATSLQNCKPCEPGRYCVGGVPKGKGNGADAQKCPPNTYQPYYNQTDSSACLPCDKDKCCAEGASKPVECGFAQVCKDVQVQNTILTGERGELSISVSGESKERLTSSTQVQILLDGGASHNCPNLGQNGTCIIPLTKPGDYLLLIEDGFQSCSLKQSVTCKERFTQDAGRCREIQEETTAALVCCLCWNNIEHGVPSGMCTTR